ncbi:hypothetical protein [Amycolatopsis sp. YIM 10]|uniref:terminase small subunit n=1 Tax=Amycolatopsis sp. YIM 10 TaxID=2653857 RepID=UPI0012902480|nr:hypothetical protein [Amycolatopsis sp. YIM 10]
MTDDQPVDGLLGAVERTLDTLDLEDEDAAACELARRLARAIDDETSGRTIAELGGKLLAVLGDLGATPAARKAIVPKGGTPGDGDGGNPKRAKLHALRAEHAVRTGTD